MVKYLLALKHLPIQPNFAKKICSFCSAWTLSTLSSFIVNPDLLLIKDDTLFFRNIILIVDFPVVFFNLILNWSLLTSNVQINLQQDCLKLSKALSEGRLCWSDLEVEELEKVARQVWGKTDNNGFLTKQHSSEKNPTNPESCDFDNFECQRTLKRQSWSRTDWVPFTQSRP